MQTYRINGVNYDNFKSMLNVARGYAKEKGIDLNSYLKTLYDENNPNCSKTCSRCGADTEYISYTKGYKQCCYSKECYKNFILRNEEYYSNLPANSFVDLYDGRAHEIAFTKIFANVTSEIAKQVLPFFKEHKCEWCGKEMRTNVFDRISSTCSKECKHNLIGKKGSEKKQKVLEKVSDDLDVLRPLNHKIFSSFSFPAHIDKKSAKKHFLLRVPKQEDQIYYSSEYDLFFMKRYTNVDTYEMFIRDYLNEDVREHYSKDSSKVQRCRTCESIIGYIDVYGNKIDWSKSGCCSHKCYHEFIRKDNSSILRGAETKAKQSATMKDRIASGAFTPPVTNSWCKSRLVVEIQGKSVPCRSSWDAAFQIVNPNFLYEDVRISYTFDGKERNYIVDFHDSDNRILYEVKPDGNKSDPIVIAKEAAALEWCDKNGYKFEFVSDSWFFENRERWLQASKQQPQGELIERRLKQFLND